MKMKFLALGLSCLTVLVGGCVSTLDGKHQGGVPWITDTVDGRYERSVDQVCTATRDVIKANGVLTVENVVGKTFEGKVDTRTIWASVEAMTPNLTLLRIQVRTKGGGTDKELGTFLREQVAVRLASGNFAPSSSPVKK